ncbi:ATP-binding protein [Olsenella sp. DNF00959]|uniref:ATP-binding protein n=1 Tax=Olsenella sp. DNF00959 TaxID=1476999 RepID=UPI000780B10D|nr:ATP-binding protein [Olsenella sp. DNF00959]KXB63971.1 hypothetical protein HMPREF1868_00485 [Olsenella sp. DNF00959]
MEPIYRRELYLSRIRPFVKHADLIKVITGVRRCGKSTVMRMVADELAEQGVPERNLVFLDLDSRGYRKVRTADALDELIERVSAPEGMTYLFIDEVQNVEGFEEVLNAWRGEGTHSIFITGSNSYLLSGELATKLTGRYLEFEVFTLTFAEYEGMKRLYGKEISPNVAEEFDHFILEGGFPRAVDLATLVEKRTYVEGVVREIFEKDVKRRVQVRNVSVFERVRDYMINNFGSTTSIRNIAAYFRDVEGVPIKEETVHRYVTVLEEAKILYRCPRFDMKSRRSLAREQKYYLADLGFYFALNTDNRINYGPVLENVVYEYARAQGYSASVGRIGKLECDFILRDGAQDYSYVQVSYTIAERSTEDREYASLEKARDGYPKYLLTCDYLLQKRSGVIHENLIRFVSEERRFGFGR